MKTELVVGDSPAKAMWDFDRAWAKDLETPNADVTGLAPAQEDTT